MSEHLTVKEFAAQARVTERTVRRWIQEGRLQAKRHGKKYLIPAEPGDATAYPAAATDWNQPALGQLMAWVCDAWVDGGRARHRLVQQDSDHAERLFVDLVASVDEVAAAMDDEGLALRIRFIARDLLASVRRQPAQAAEPAAPTLAPMAAATQPLKAQPLAATTPLSASLETLPLRPAEP